MPSAQSALPPFLQAYREDASNSTCYGAVFEHGLGPAHATWWPAKEGKPDTVLLFIPGNPGLLEFYEPFLTAIHDKDTTGKLAILGHAHIAHTPDIPWKDRKPPASSYSLTAQVQSAIEAFDAIKSTYGESTKVVIIGHSVGAWISLQLLKARPSEVSAEFLLFPTISHIGDTPNGRRLSLFFSPFARYVLSSASCLVRLLPVGLLCSIFRDWPLPQVLVLQTLLHSPSSIEASLTMAYDEMTNIRDLDIPLLTEHKHRLWFYYAETDDWVGKEKDRLLSSFHPDDGSFSVVHGKQDIPHAFCINHGEHLAAQCHEWLLSIGNSRIQL